ncbi:hypothetical protein [Paractinoplanes durhamensis]|uniref:hypothetical protein n=1 Tax=Paractinoplanes durhamensis TaxID=113563 RepID=UPI00194178B0|nr:hypothetical protein [Actinoplanes durhamensis]
MSELRAPLRARIAELLLSEDQYSTKWRKYVQRARGEISWDAVAQVIAEDADIAADPDGENPNYYRKYSRPVAAALKPAGVGPNWGTLNRIMAAFKMTKAHRDELLVLMRKADAGSQ